MLGPATLDLAGWNEHEAHRLPVVDQLQRAVIVGELVPVRVGDRDVLEEGEVNGSVGDRESWKLHGVDSNFGNFGPEK